MLFPCRPHTKPNLHRTRKPGSPGLLVECADDVHRVLMIGHPVHAVVAPAVVGRHGQHCEGGQMGGVVCWQQGEGETWRRTGLLVDSGAGCSLTGLPASLEASGEQHKAALPCIAAARPLQAPPQPPRTAGLPCQAYCMITRPAPPA